VKTWGADIRHIGSPGKCHREVPSLTLAILPANLGPR